MEELSNNYGFIFERDFAIPLWEVAIFVSVISFCLLFGRHRMGLLVTYGFVFYWGFISNISNFARMLENTEWGMPLYVFSGFLMFIVVIVGFWVESRS
jgi:sterol desaturase/sphingolipid hydroxylase (fatty acid hydroxylase superfamily)